jgi:MraW methylase family
MELHRPVMTQETLEGLDAARGGLFVDATLGLGGHSELILRASPNSRVIGFDRDAESIELASARLAEFGERFMAGHIGRSRYFIISIERAGARLQLSFRSRFYRIPIVVSNFTNRSIRIPGGHIPIGYADGSFTEIDSGRFS